MPRMTRSPRRLAAVAASVGLVVAVAVGISLVVAWQSSLTMENAAPTQAAARFEEVRRRFPAARPLLEIVTTDGHRGMIVHRERVPASPVPATTMRALAWRASDESLAAVRLPFWFVRMKMGAGRGTLGALLPPGWDVVRVSADDLERHGQGLLLDEQASNGDRLLLWME